MSFEKLWDRMKMYEKHNNQSLLHNWYHILRIDGKAFHTFTKWLIKPFDKSLKRAFVNTLTSLMWRNHEGIQLAKIWYHQSDEISILFHANEDVNQELWFKWKIQKIVSVASSLTTWYFNKYYNYRNNKIAFFDTRVFSLPNKDEVYNYFLWRTRDCYKNAIQSIARTQFSQKELHQKHSWMLRDMISKWNWLKVEECSNFDIYWTYILSWNDREYYLKDNFEDIKNWLEPHLKTYWE